MTMKFLEINQFFSKVVEDLRVKDRGKLSHS